MNFFNKILRRFRNDRADGVLVMFFIAVPLFTLLLGFGININTAIDAKTEYTAMAQTSTDTAVKSLSSNGSLGTDSVTKFVQQYRTQYQNSSGAVRIGNNCTSGEVDGETRQFPYAKIQLDTTTRSPGDPTTSAAVYTAEGMSQAPVNIKQLDPKVKYRVITVTVYTASSNLLDIFGIPSCQSHQSVASSVAFGSNSDLND